MEAPSWIIWSRGVLARRRDSKAESSRVPRWSRLTIHGPGPRALRSSRDRGPYRDRLVGLYACNPYCSKKKKHAIHGRIDSRRRVVQRIQKRRVPGPHLTWPLEKANLHASGATMGTRGRAWGMDYDRNRSLRRERRSRSRDATRPRANRGRLLYAPDWWWFTGKSRSRDKSIYTET